MVLIDRNLINENLLGLRWLKQGSYCVVTDAEERCERMGVRYVGIDCRLIYLGNT